jgi:hypothetical protein
MADSGSKPFRISTGGSIVGFLTKPFCLNRRDNTLELID